MKQTHVLALLASILLSCGCASNKSEPQESAKAPQKFSTADISAGKSLSEKYVSSLVKAIQNNDFKEISPYLNVNTVNIRQKRAVFEKLCARLAQNGKLVSASFVAAIDQTLCQDYVWKLDFIKQTSSSQLPQIKTSMLYSIRVVISEGKPKIIGARLIQL